MTERPIIFSGAMVRAILAGRKTQTRRVVKGVEFVGGRGQENDPGQWGFCDADGDYHLIDLSLPLPGRRGGPPYRIWCPYGEPGDRLWVRESFRISGHEDCDRRIAECATREHCHYRADPDEPPAPGQWKPSIFMPRHVSRITLEVEAVRAERLQDISAVDVGAEGIDASCYSPGPDWPIQNAMRVGWDAINGKRNGGAYQWSANPWVWALTFRVPA
jgi:hypothetical protein